MNGDVWQSRKVSFDLFGKIIPNLTNTKIQPPTPSKWVDPLDHYPLFLKKCPQAALVLSSIMYLVCTNLYSFFVVT